MSNPPSLLPTDGVFDMITQDHVGPDGKVSMTYIGEDAKPNQDPIRVWPVDANEMLRSGHYKLTEGTVSVPLPPIIPTFKTLMTKAHGDLIEMAALGGVPGVTKTSAKEEIANAIINHFAIKMGFGPQHPQGSMAEDTDEISAPAAPSKKVGKETTKKRGRRATNGNKGTDTNENEEGSDDPRT